jgi:hypothetical protein
MRLANVAQDNWRLRSAEISHAVHPETFEVPPAVQRHNLKRGQAAKLMFEIESEDENGISDIACERMWVIVSDKVDETYIGILDSQPVSIEHGEDVYLCFGAEVPFKAEHVIEIDSPPTKYSDWQLGQKPEREWSRE